MLNEKVGLEYNIVPECDLQNSMRMKIGIVYNSYIGIHAGIFLGGGKCGE